MHFAPIYVKVSPSLWHCRATDERVYHDKLTIEIAPNNENTEADHSVASSAPASFDPDTLERNLERRNASEEEKGIFGVNWFFHSVINWMFRPQRSLFGIFFNWILYEVSQSLKRLHHTLYQIISLHKSLFRAQKQFLATRGNTKDEL